MPSLTTDNLRKELQRFATDDLQSGLNALYTRIEQAVHNEIQGAFQNGQRGLSGAHSRMVPVRGAKSEWSVDSAYQSNHNAYSRRIPREETCDSTTALIREQTGRSVSPRETVTRGAAWAESSMMTQGTSSVSFDDTKEFDFEPSEDMDGAPFQRGISNESLNDSLHNKSKRLTYLARYRKSVCSGTEVYHGWSSTGSNKSFEKSMVPFGGGFRRSYAPEELGMTTTVSFGKKKRPTALSISEEDKSIASGVSRRSVPDDANPNSPNTRMGSTSLNSSKPIIKPRKTFTDSASPSWSYTAMLSSGNMDYQTRTERLTELLTTIVTDWHFDLTIGALIVLNAIILGLETDWEARNFPQVKPCSFEIINVGFCVAFTFEIMMRFCVHGLQFLSMPGWPWNVFDCALVGLQVFSEIMRYIWINYLGVKHQLHYQFVVLRVMRIFRIVRVLRLVHVLHIVGELRMLLVSVAGSVRSLFWTVLLLLMLTYVFGLYLTQLVVDFKIQNPDKHDEQQELVKYYGTLSRTMLSLYQTISDGIHWHEVMDPLASHCSQWIALVFALYIAFTLFALMNVITGVFVESAMRTAEEDKRRLLINQMRQLFEGADVDHSGTISWDEFQTQMENPQMQTYLKAIDLHQEEARELFHLLDIDGSGEIDAVDFVNGCLRLHGSAKAIDFAAFLHEYRWLSLKIADHITYAENCWAHMCPEVVKQVDGEDEEVEVGLIDHGIQPSSSVLSISSNRPGGHRLVQTDSAGGHRHPETPQGAQPFGDTFSLRRAVTAGLV